MATIGPTLSPAAASVPGELHDSGVCLAAGGRTDYDGRGRASCNGAVAVFKHARKALIRWQLHAARLREHAVCVCVCVCVCRINQSFIHCFVDPPLREPSPVTAYDCSSRHIHRRRSSSQPRVNFAEVKVAAESLSVHGSCNLPCAAHNGLDLEYARAPPCNFWRRARRQPCESGAGAAGRKATRTEPSSLIRKSAGMRNCVPPGQQPQLRCWSRAQFTKPQQGPHFPWPRARPPPGQIPMDAASGRHLLQHIW